MKRGWITLLLVSAVTLFLIGCSSPMKEAQKMMDAGQYEQVVTKYGSNPELASIVAMAKDKIVEKLFAEGKYNTIVENYKDHRMFKEAENKLAEALLAGGKLDEVIARYPNSPAAMQAKLKQQQMLSDSLAAVADEKLTDAEKKVRDTQKQVEKAKDDTADMAEKAAENELKRILALANPDMKKKALQSFVNKAEYKNTAAHAKGVAELAKL